MMGILTLSQCHRFSEGQPANFLLSFLPKGDRTKAATYMPEFVPRYIAVECKTMFAESVQVLFCFSF